jgi:hypothetical protein
MSFTTSSCKLNPMALFDPNPTPFRPAPSLTLSGQKLTSAELQEKLKALPTVGEIYLSNCDLEDEQVEVICKKYGSELLKLDLSNNVKISNISLYHIATHCKKLIELNLASTMPSEKYSACRFWLIQLEELPNSQYESGLDYLFSIPTLEKLNLKGNCVVKAGTIDTHLAALESQNRKLVITRDAKFGSAASLKELSKLLAPAICAQHESF